MTKVNHDLRSYDGATIYHGQEIGGSTGPGNLKIPNVFAQDESMLYPIGTRLVLGNRTFHYCHFTTAITKTLAGKVSWAGRPATYGQPASYDASQAVETVEYKVDGVSAGVPAENYYAGAYIIPWVTGGLTNPTMRILKSSASALDSVYTSQQTVVLTLEQPTPVVIGANTANDIFLSKYSDVREAWAVGTGYHPFVGVPLRTFTDEYYGWIQTWGPCFIVHAAADQIGDNVGWRTVAFTTDGSLMAFHESSAGSESAQICGHTLAINGAGSEWTQLMIDP